MSFDIRHANILDVDKAIRHYEKKDGVSITYVCTTDLRQSDRPADVFYRETPHPEFGNRYFGLFRNPHPAADADGNIYITNADVVEDHDFAMIQDDNGTFWYSQCHHDCLFIDGKMIDGGREYVRFSGNARDIKMFKIKDGQFKLESEE